MGHTNMGSPNIMPTQYLVAPHLMVLPLIVAPTINGGPNMLGHPNIRGLIDRGPPPFNGTPII